MRIGNTIYMDFQATTPMDSRVLSEMTPYLVDGMGNPHSLDHSIGWSAAKAVDAAASRVAQLIGADADEIIFTSGATESNNLAILGLGRRAAGGKRNRILVSSVEHKCVLAASRILGEQLGYQVDELAVDDKGRVALRTLENDMDDDVLLVSIMAVNNEIGTIQAVGKIAEIVKQHGAIFHCDAAQAPCALNLSSIADEADVVSLSAHKMYGPMGIGALYVGRHLQDQIEPLVYGGGQQHGLRSGTVPVPLCVGMGAAAALFNAGEEARAERESLRRRRNYFVESLKNLCWPIALNGPSGDDRHPGNANMRFGGFLAHEILGALQPYLAASTGSACTSGIPEPSHVLKAIGLAADEAEASIRFSLGRGTTDTDIDEAVRLIDKSLAKLENAMLMHSA